MNTVKTIAQFPLTFGFDTTPWQRVRVEVRKAITTIVDQRLISYSKSKESVNQYFSANKLVLDQPVREDSDAKSLLDTVFEVEEVLIKESPGLLESYRRASRHIREYLSEWLLQEHLSYLEGILARGKEGAIEIARQFNMSDQFDTPKSYQRFSKKIQIYLDVGSFIHTPELELSAVKVRTRSSARAKRGNLWPCDRRNKYEFLENLANSGKVIPEFTEADLEFLVSQSSMDMLQKKTDILLSELKCVEPNRLKANYSRLRDHLQRSNQRTSDFQRRRELLIKLGATHEQIEYISARATYQTMKNLLRLANGKLAISDLMGGKRTIRKLLRRRGQTQSRAEVALSRYLVNEEGISNRIAVSYARTRKNHSIQHLQRTLTFLKENYKQFYRNHWGFEVNPNVLRRALELGLSRQKLSKRTLVAKDFVNDLRKALAQEESAVVKKQNNLSAQDRRVALNPLKEVLEYETDTFTKKQLYFIYELFCNHGLCISKEKLREICLKDSDLFPSQRKVQDALEILNNAYRAIGLHGEQLCVLPDYLEIPASQKTHSISSTM